VLEAWIPNSYQMNNPGFSIITRKAPFQMTNTSWANYVSAYLIGRGGPLGCGYQQYGYFQTVLTQPPQTGGALGSWTAWWMLPVNNDLTYELDMFERFSNAFGPGTPPSMITTTLHYNSYANSVVLCQATDANGWSGSHTYAVDWEPSSIQIYIDGVLCTASGSNPTGTYTGAGIPAEVGYMLWDDYVSGASGNAAADALMPRLMTISSVGVWQKNSNTQTVMPIHVGNMTTDKASYNPGDVATLTLPITAGSSNLGGVTYSGFVFDFCGDNNSGFSPCMFPATNNTFGAQFLNTVGTTINAGVTTSLTSTWTVPTTIPPGVYTLEYSAHDTGSVHSDSGNARIVVGNPFPP
jgi:hypothetical protein